MRYLSLSEYAEIEKVSTVTAWKRCNNGKISGAIKEPSTKNQTGFVWKIPVSEVAGKIGEEVEGPVEFSPSGGPRRGNGPVTVVPSSKQEIFDSLKDLRATVQEANRIHRIEQCLKLYYENRLREKTLVDFSRLKDDFEDIMRIFLDDLREIVEKWALKHAFKPALLVEIQEEFERSIEKTHGKLKRLLNKP